MGKVSMESAHQLHNQMRVQIPEFERMADKCATILVAINEVPETDAAIALKAVSETLLMLCYINLDLMAAYRQYFSTDTSTHYEDRQAMTKINVVMSEAYKKIYGFGDQQQKSFWISKIKQVVNFVGISEDEYRRIEDELKSIGSDNVLNKDMRDLSVHYDSDPMKVYNMLSSISAEEVIGRCGKFMNVLKDVTGYVTFLLDLIEKELKVV